MAEDPAIRAAERRRRVDALIGSAREHEERASQHLDGQRTDAAALEMAMAACLRLDAICRHLGLGPGVLPAAEPEGEDPGVVDRE